MTDTELLLQVEAERPRLEGWCSAEKARRLAATILDIRPGLCVEIGVFGGQSLIPQALALKHLGHGQVVGIDPWSMEAALEEMQEGVSIAWWSRNVNYEAVYRQCLHHVQRLALGEHCQLLRTRATQAASQFGPETIGVLHIDGNHSEARSLEDAQLYLPRVAPGGYIFFDDLSWTEKSVNTTGKAFAHLLANGCREIGRVGDCAILQKR